MNFNLIEKNVGDELVRTVLARELQAALGNTTAHNMWITRAIEAAYLIENIDYTILCIPVSGGTDRKDYYLTIEAAKSIAMMQRSEIGKRIRDYFINIESEYKKTLIEAKKPEQELSLFDSLAAGFAKMAQVEREQKQQSLLLSSLQNRTEAIEARQSAIIDQSSYFSVLAYAIKNDINMTTGQASSISRKCGKLSKDLGSTIGTIVDPRFGSVKTYHETILHEVFLSKKLILE